MIAAAEFQRVMRDAAAGAFEGRTFGYDNLRIAKGQTTRVGGASARPMNGL